MILDAIQYILNGVWIFLQAFRQFIGWAADTFRYAFYSLIGIIAYLCMTFLEVVDIFKGFVDQATAIFLTAEAQGSAISSIAMVTPYIDAINSLIPLDTIGDSLFTLMSWFVVTSSIRIMKSFIPSIS